jgi:type IV pilus assembly protein PilC
MFFDKLFLKMPSIGPFLKMYYLSRFAENLSTLISGGLPIAQALDITADIVDNAAYKEIILNTKEGVKRGDSISSVLSAASNIFPPMFYQMVSVGERTGTLDKSLMDVVDFYQKETERMIETLLSSLEPLLIMFLGLVVGGLMFAILMPMYQMMTF